MQDTVADMLFDAEVGLGLQVVRYNIGGSNTSMNATSSMRSFAAIPSMLLADGTYNWSLVSLTLNNSPDQLRHICSVGMNVYTPPAQICLSIL